MSLNNANILTCHLIAEIPMVSTSSENPTLFCFENGIYYRKKLINGVMTWYNPMQMLMSVYDSNSNGVVDDAEKLGGQPPAYYAKQSDLDAKAGTAAATTVSNGLMSAADKVKLNALVLTQTFYAGGSATTSAVILAGGAQDVSIIYDAPLPALSGKTAADTRVIACITGGVSVSLLGQLTAAIKSRTLAGCVVTLTNKGLVSAALGITVEAIATETGVPA